MDPYTVTLEELTPMIAEKRKAKDERTIKVFEKEKIQFINSSAFCRKRIGFKLNILEPYRAYSSDAAPRSGHIGLFIGQLQIQISINYAD